MRLSQSAPPTLLSLLAIVLTSTHTSNAKPYLRKLHLDTSNALEARNCANPCGSEGQYCCQASEHCVTSGWPPIAQCVSGAPTAAALQIPNANSAGSGQYQLVTTTWTETDLVLRTSTYSVPLGTPTSQQATVATALSCNSQLGESPCGSICCAAAQQCQWQGGSMMCVATGGVSGDVSSFYYSSVTAATSGSAAIRPTSNTVQTVTSTGSATTTVSFVSASATQGGATAGMQATTSNNGLSGGAIAGIVIGVLVGIFLLLLICAACCFKGLLDTILGFFGLGPKRRRREETIIEERHSHHHGGGGGGGGGGGRWFGATGPSRIDRPKKSGGFGGATAVAAGLTTLAVILGLKRRRDRREKGSYGTRSSYSYDYDTSSSSASSDRRTAGRYSRR
ncbi:MAG: hypothetical protein LQ350_001411 [Teloschistes chrysophthalmus]|nr:MAG: hypothetical protein LQ350_001411 [Niorma chrysophthalma]